MDVNFYVNQLQKFVGKKITRIVTDVSDPQFFGFQIDGRDGWILWFLSDDEGNGPGSFEIQKLPPK